MRVLFLIGCCGTTVGNVCWFRFIVSTAFFYSLSAVCQYLTLWRLFVLCHSFHCCLLILSTVCRYFKLYALLFLSHCFPCCLLQSVQCLSVPHAYSLLVLCQCVQCCLLQSLQNLPLPQNLPSVVSVYCDHCCFLESVLCVITSRSTLFGFVSVSPAVFYILSTVCQYLRLYSRFSVTVSKAVF